jgi:hypothetical protein
MVSLRATQTMVLREFDLRLEPELCFSLGVMRVDMHAWLLAREEVETEAFSAKDGGAHACYRTP